MNIQEIHELIKTEIPYGGESSKIATILHNELVEGNHIANIIYSTDKSKEGQFAVVLEDTCYWLNSFPTFIECADWCDEQKFKFIVGRWLTCNTGNIQR